MCLLQNVFPEKTTSFRHVVYTCYQPASMADEAGMAEKKRMYKNYLISTHWPAMNVASHGNGEGQYNLTTSCFSDFFVASIPAKLFSLVQSVL